MKNENWDKRTSSYRGEPEFDNMIADCDISSLRFLSENYDKKLDDYKDQHNLDNIEYWREYKSLQRRKKMIDEELSVRLMNESAISTRRLTEFDSMNNILYSNDDSSIQENTRYVAFNEEENGYIVSDLEGNVVDEFIVEDDEVIVPQTRKSRYEGWTY